MEANSLKIEKHIFEKALRRKVTDRTVKLLGISNRCITGKGVNFLSDLFEASLKYTLSSKNEKEEAEHTMHAIIKTEPLSETSLEFVRQQNLFFIELRFLRDVLPKVNELLGSQIGPRLWYGCENPRVLIMENLTRKGFIMKDRQKGLPLEHCCLVMQRIAKLHAATVAISEKDPGLMESFKDAGIVSKKCPPPFYRLMEVSLLLIGNAVRKWSDKKCVTAAEKIIKLAETIVSRCIDVYDYDADEFCVLNHGDCWINNLMFKEDENGRPTDLHLVDYQMAVYSSPAIDLLYFLNICPEYAVKYDMDDYLLETYLNTLTETMKNIGCKRNPPTMRELRKAIHKRKTYAVFSGAILYLRMMANPEDVEDFTLVLKKFCGETKMDVFKNPDAVKLAKKMIPVMNERGYFD